MKKDLKIKKNCLNCGVEIFVWPSYIARGNGKYCSKKCFLEYRKKYRTYNYDVTFIKKDSNFRSYFLGLFVSDGYIGKKGEIIISLTDFQIIRDLANYLNYTNKIGKYKPKKRKIKYTLRFCGPIYEFIKSLKFIPGPKTGKEFIPKIISKKAFPSFLRGFIDGDGCFSIRKNNGGLDLCLVCANWEFLDDIYLQLKMNNIIKGGSFYLHSKSKEKGRKYVWYLKFRHMDSLAIGKYIYKNATIFLERKYKKYLIGVEKGLIINQKDKICIIDGCTNQCHCKNLCKYHYKNIRGKTYYTANKKQILKKQIERRQLNREQINERNRELYALKKEKERARLETTL